MDSPVFPTSPPTNPNHDHDYDHHHHHFTSYQYHLFHPRQSNALDSGSSPHALFPIKSDFQHATRGKKKKSRGRNLPFPPSKHTQKRRRRISSTDHLFPLRIKRALSWDPSYFFFFYRKSHVDHLRPVQQCNSAMAGGSRGHHRQFLYFMPLTSTLHFKVRDSNPPHA